MKVITKLILVSTVFFFALIISCRKFDNFNTEIILAIPDKCLQDNYTMYVLDTDRKGSTKHDFDKINGQNGPFNYLADIEKKDEMVITIDWEEYPYVDPKEKLSFYIEQQIGTYSQEDPVIWETEFMKIKPGKIYTWDPETGNFKYTGNRTEKQSDGGEDSNCSGCECISKTWDLQSLNGNSLPWKEYDDGSNSLTWTKGTFTYSSSGTWNSSITSKQVANGNTNYVDTDESGTYTCSGSTVTMTNTSSPNGGSWKGTISNNKLTWSTGGRTFVYN